MKDYSPHPTRGGVSLITASPEDRVRRAPLVLEGNGFPDATARPAAGTKRAVQGEVVEPSKKQKTSHPGPPRPGHVMELASISGVLADQASTAAPDFAPADSEDDDVDEFSAPQPQTRRSSRFESALGQEVVLRESTLGCPADPFLGELESQGRFLTAQAARTHCLKTHVFLIPGKSSCKCPSDIKWDIDACRKPGCPWFFANRNQGKYPKTWRPGCSNFVPTTRRLIPSWVKDIVAWVCPLRASSSVPGNWSDVAFVQWLILHQCNILGKRIDRVIVPHPVTSILCPPAKTPFVRDVSSILDKPQLIARERSGTDYRPSFTDNVIDRLSSQPGLSRLIMDDLLSSGSSIDRLRLFIKDFGRPIGFIYTERNAIVTKNTRSAKKLTKSGLDDGVLVDGQPFCCIHSDELMAEPPSDKVQILIKLWEDDITGSLTGANL
jgi:hypothetical protein